MERLPLRPLVLGLALLLSACDTAGGARDDGPGGPADVADPGGDPGGDPAPGDPGPADPGTEAGDTAPADLPDDGDPDAPGPGDLPADAKPDAPVDVPPSTCCMYDYMCPQGWQCVAVPGQMGACKPPPGDGACWSGHDCGPGRTCLGARACPCGEGGPADCTDATGHCVDDAAGCCDTDWDCPAGQACDPGNTCQPIAAPGRCWTDGDCYGTGQACEGVVTCPCGATCGVAPRPGTCAPLPSGCCHSDADCPDDTECRFASPRDHLPGRCVGAHLWEGCPQGESCCWEDGDCPGGWCDGAVGCGCIELCPACGACQADALGRCKAWDIEVKLSSSAGECVPGVEVPDFAYYRLPLAWHTSLPAKTQVERAVNAFTGAEGYIPLDEGYVQDHAFELRMGTYAFEAPAKAGDVMRIRVRATGAGGEKGLSEDLLLPVDEAMAACMYPYDRTCSDGVPIVCRAIPPACEADKVRAAFQGCQHCVYAATCTCDDGSAPTCPVDETPSCEAPRVLAVQQGCWTCVHPITCSATSGW